MSTSILYKHSSHPPFRPFVLFLRLAGYFDVPNLIEGIRRTDSNFVFIDCCFVQRLLSESLQDAGCKHYLIRNPFDMTFKFHRSPLPLSADRAYRFALLCVSIKKNRLILADLITINFCNLSCIKSVRRIYAIIKFAV